ncbi:endonuclease/exonuclease/phosphatase family protein [Marmoricola sp. RAF53]|uniref:endonuclease/exonuclease/phosphatase family protein n=1 Tax=Marmoricola sp. RAF53 TaxID=3233059 RepID=UPI003F9E269F
MRVATFNILNARRPSDEQVDLAGLRAAVACLDADVLALQEVDHNQDRSHGADLTAIAADAMGAVDQRFVAALSGNPGATWVAATDRDQPDAAAYGIALLSRHPVTSWHLVRLPVLHAPTPLWFRGHVLPTLVRDEPRVAVAAVVDTPGGRVSVATTHLSFVPWWNGRQLRHLTASLAQVPRPLLLLGDLNMGPRRAARITGMRGLVTAATFPSEQPREQLDHILLDGGCRVLSTGAPELPVSDHRALVVDLA